MKKVSFAFAVVLISSLMASAQSFTKHTLKATYVSTARIDAAVPSDFQAIDGVNTVVCPGTTGKCLIQADAWIQVMGSQSDNLAGICFRVDGVWPNCPAVDNIPNGSVGVLTTSQGATVTAGTHTVQTVLYTLLGTYVGGYTFTYRVYKP